CVRLYDYGDYYAMDYW
nr:immunoglobulin heavy chain junction region [Mus musculus]